MIRLRREWRSIVVGIGLVVFGVSVSCRTPSTCEDASAEDGVLTISMPRHTWYVGEDIRLQIVLHPPEHYEYLVVSTHPLLGLFSVSVLDKQGISPPGEVHYGVDPEFFRGGRDAIVREEIRRIEFEISLTRQNKALYQIPWILEPGVYRVQATYDATRLADWRVSAYEENRNWFFEGPAESNILEFEVVRERPRHLPRIPASERGALIEFYEKAGGPNWFRNDRWLGPLGTECTWLGVRCDAGSTTVIELDLRGRRLTGSIPDSLAELSNLLYLRLAQNDLSGPIPAGLGKLTSLIWLDLERNQLNGPIPKELGNLSNLEWLDLAENQIEGEIPGALGKLTRLRRLDLSGNRLGGEIPAKLGKLLRLQKLELSSNEISGPIPDELTNLRNLRFLGLSSNSLVGRLPAGISRLQRLVNLSLYNNRLEGPIPEELGSLFHLERVNLSMNRFSGEIPRSLGKLRLLRELDLSVNRLSGRIPTDIGELKRLQYLNLSGNRITGTIPQDLDQRGELFWLRFSKDEF